MSGIDTSSRFFDPALSAEELQLATQVTPLFLAYLQKKIVAYATACIDARLPYNSDPGKQVEAIIEHERLRTYVAAYEELLGELVQSSN